MATNDRNVTLRRNLEQAIHCLTEAASVLENIEKTVRELLTANRLVTYTDVWSSVLKEYPNSLTPDSSSITRALKKFAVRKKAGLYE